MPVDLRALKGKQTTQKTFRHHFLQEMDIESTESAAGRLYRTPEGLYYPSVTTFLGHLEEDDSWLSRWVESLGGQEAADKEMQRRMDRGTGVHLALEYLLRNEPQPQHSGAYLKMYKQLEGLLRIHCDDVYALELALYSKLLKLAGRVDCIAKWKGVLSIIDFKTSQSWKQTQWIQDYFLQTTCYSIMLEEIYGIKAEQIVILVCIEEEEKPQVFVKERSEFMPMLADKLKEFRAKQKQDPQLWLPCEV